MPVNDPATWHSTACVNVIEDSIAVAVDNSPAMLARLEHQG